MLSHMHRETAKAVVHKWQRILAVECPTPCVEPSFEDALKHIGWAELRLTQLAELQHMLMEAQGVYHFRPPIELVEQRQLTERIKAVKLAKGFMQKGLSHGTETQSLEV